MKATALVQICLALHLVYSTVAFGDVEVERAEKINETIIALKNWEKDVSSAKLDVGSKVPNPIIALKNVTGIKIMSEVFQELSRAVPIIRSRPRNLEAIKTVVTPVSDDDASFSVKVDASNGTHYFSVPVCLDSFMSESTVDQRAPLAWLFRSTRTYANSLAQQNPELVRLVSTESLVKCFEILVVATYSFEEISGSSDAIARLGTRNDLGLLTHERVNYRYSVNFNSFDWPNIVMSMRVYLLEPRDLINFLHTNRIQRPPLVVLKTQRAISSDELRRNFNPEMFSPPFDNYIRSVVGPKLEMFIKGV